MILDVLLVAIIAVVAWCVASEGAWGAALTLVSVILAGLLAMNLFEATAGFLERSVSDSFDWRHRWDVIAMVGLFAGFVFAFRRAAEQIMPTHIELHGHVYDVCRWVCGLATGYITMAFLLTALHTAPLPPGFLGFTPEPARRGGPLGQSAPDMNWLGFVHFMSETAFRNGGGPVFDGPRYALYPGGTPQVLPTFPIRYASRRDRYFGVAETPTTTTITPGPSRASGGGGGNSGPRF